MPLFPRFQQATDNPHKIYGIWGDENGDDGDKPMVGEASISMATACFGTSMTGNNGHDETDVLYIAFPGTDAVPGASGANWGATSWSAFETSIEALGNKLIARIGGGSAASSSSSTTSKATTTKTTSAAPTTSTVTCAWAGHCLGASCTTNDDCSDPWGCVSGKCALDAATSPSTTLKTSTITKTTTSSAPTTTATSCAWAGHCLGATCTTNDDCSDPWACISGKCAVDPAVPS